MLNSLDQHFIEKYAADLRRELTVHGFTGDRTDEVVGEATAHLEEAMAAAKPQSVGDVNQVIGQFGSAAVMSRRLAAEELRPAKRKWFLWPMLFIPAALCASLNPLPQTRVFHDSLYIGTLYLLISAAILFVMGMFARRPLFGQFAVLVVGMIVGQVGWYAAKSYPVAYSPGGHVEWYEAVPRSGYGQEIGTLTAAITRDRNTIDQMKLGQRVFTGSTAPKDVPPQFTYRGQYWFPEGVREVGLGIQPEKISPSLLTSSWSEAVAAYNGSQYRTSGTVTSPQLWEGDAARQLRQVPDEIAMFQRAIDNLKWIRTQPLIVQMLADFRMVAMRTVFMVGLAALCTNGGWVAWVLFRMLGRLRRRILYRAGGLQTA